MSQSRRALPLLSLSALLAAAPPDLGPDHAFLPTSRWTDVLGQTHVRYEHRFRGLRVWGSEFIDHQGPGAAPPTRALAVAPAPSPGIRAFADAVPVQGEPILWPVMVEVPLGDDPDATHVDRNAAGYRRALYVKARFPAEDPGAEAYDAILDAGTGEVLEEIPVDLPETPAKGRGLSLYRGPVSLDTTQEGSLFYLKDLTRGTGGPLGANGVIDHRYGTGPDWVYPNYRNTWGDGQPEAPQVDTSSPNGQTMGVDMAAGIQTAWDYFLKIHGRPGPDGRGRSVTGWAHGTDLADNAVWMRGGLFYLVVYRPVEWRPETSLFTLGHEFAHGVTEFSAGLAYKGESGGLNEATSDFFGAMVKTWDAGGQGPRIGQAGYEPFFARTAANGERIIDRFFPKPSLGRNRAPDEWYPGVGDLDPHISSGPMNRALFFLSQGATLPKLGTNTWTRHLPDGMAGIGNDDTARIWYRALTTYLTSASTYQDARTAAVQAAKDLFDAAAPQHRAVLKAFQGIAVGNADADPVLNPVALPATATPQGTLLTLAATPQANPAWTLFYVDGILAGRVAGAPSSLTLDASRTFANGPHSMVAKTFSEAGLTAVSAPVAFNLDNPVQQLLQDPGFEGLGQGWTGPLAQVISPVTDGAAVHGGVRALKFSPAAAPLKRIVHQTVTIPAEAKWAMVNLWVKLEGARPGASNLQIVATDDAGGDEALDVNSFEDPMGRWIRKSMDVSSMAGETVDVSLDFARDPDSDMTLWVDDVTLLFSTEPPVNITVTPPAVAVWEGSTDPINLTAVVTGSQDGTVAWEAQGGGAITAGGVYTPPLVPGNATILARSNALPEFFAEVPVEVKPILALEPVAANLDAGTAAAFSLSAAPAVDPVVTVSGGPSPGTVQVVANPPGVAYTAPQEPGTYVIEVKDRNSAAVARSVITVRPPVAVLLDPPAVTLAAGAGMQFHAEVLGDPTEGVAWSLDEADRGGWTGSTGLFAAPLTPGVYHVRATSLLAPSHSAVAQVTVLGGPALNPAKKVLLTGDSVTFRATVPAQGDPSMTWSVQEGPAGGSMQGATYTAPAAAGTYTVVATRVADPTQTAQATVTVRTTDLNGDGQTYLDFADLAILADAYGASAPVEKADLNGDGVVDDADLALFLSRFGGQ